MKEFYRVGVAFIFAHLSLYIVCDASFRDASSLVYLTK
ncbi:hypothetical protein bthur0005_60930 [Bacillus thuringiensis serovar pakistani str. T13001]|nr:hypothetical protein bthur0005_60930 [Bacillus thuringiensis serovar pakistani str. T13001]